MWNSKQSEKHPAGGENLANCSYTGGPQEYCTSGEGTGKKQLSGGIDQGEKTFLQEEKRGDREEG